MGKLSTIFRGFVKQVKFAANDGNINLEQKEKIADDLMDFYKKNITSQVTRSRIGMPDHLFMFKEARKVDTEELVSAFKDGDYDLVREEN